MCVEKFALKLNLQSVTSWMISMEWFGFVNGSHFVVLLHIWNQRLHYKILCCWNLEIKLSSIRSNNIKKKKTFFSISVFCNSVSKINMKIQWVIYEYLIWFFVCHKRLFWWHGLKDQTIFQRPFQPLFFIQHKNCEIFNIVIYSKTFFF